MALIATSAATFCWGWLTKKKVSKRTGKAINEIVKAAVEASLPTAARLKEQYQGKIPDDNARWLQSDARIAIKKECNFKRIAPPDDDHLNEMIEGKIKTIKRERKLPPSIMADC